MKSFFLMLGFLTRLPVPKHEFTEEGFQKAMKLMPLAGLIIGAILVLISLLFAKFYMINYVRGAILTCAYIVMTGGLHLDGLADTFDGIFSGKSREQSLKIMRDSRIGVFGMLGLFMTGLLYFSLFIEAPLAALLAFPIIGRACCLISASASPYAREDGMGKATGQAGGPGSVLVAIISILGGSFLTIFFVAVPALRAASSHIGWYALLSRTFDSLSLPLICSIVAAGAAVLVTIFMTAYFKKKLGGVTGDTYGAVIEISSIVYLLVFSVAYPMLKL